MVETLVYADGILIESRFGFVSDSDTRGTTLPLSPISGSSIEQRGYKKVHWTERELKSLVESSQFVLVRSVSSLEQNGISVAFTCSDDYDPSRQPREFSCWLNKMRSGTCWVQANWRVTVEGESSVNKLTEVFSSQNTTVQEVGAASSDVAEPATDTTEIYKTAKETVSDEQGQLLRAVEPDHGVLEVKAQRQRVILEFTHSLLSFWCPAGVSCCVG